MYEYVTKAEYKPLHQEATRILQKMQSQLKNEFPFTFQLIGSGKRRLVTRIKGGNKGFDLDYNLILKGNFRNYKPQKVKQRFMNAMKNALKGSDFDFSDPKDSSSVITLQRVDQKNSKIKCSCDFAIICYDYDNESNLTGYQFLKNDKNTGNYIWNFRPIKHNPDELVKKIRKQKNGWNLIRDEYLRLKNCNEGKKKPSYSIYIEAVNNIYNCLFPPASKKPADSRLHEQNFLNLARSSSNTILLGSRNSKRPDLFPSVNVYPLGHPALRSSEHFHTKMLLK